MDEEGKELTSDDIWACSSGPIISTDAPMTLVKQQLTPTGPDNRELIAKLRKADGSMLTLEGEGNGPIDAFVDALQKGLGVEFSFLDYHEHAVGRGANATAASYVEIQDADGRVVHGVGMDPSIVMASLKAILSAVQRLNDERREHCGKTTPCRALPGKREGGRERAADRAGHRGSISLSSFGAVRDNFSSDCHRSDPFEISGDRRRRVFAIRRTTKPMFFRIASRRLSRSDFLVRRVNRAVDTSTIRARALETCEVDDTTKPTTGALMAESWS